jgi:hypothetical protein
VLVSSAGVFFFQLQLQLNAFENERRALQSSLDELTQRRAQLYAQQQTNDDRCRQRDERMRSAADELGVTGLPVHIPDNTFVMHSTARQLCTNMQQSVDDVIQQLRVFTVRFSRFRRNRDTFQTQSAHDEKAAADELARVQRARAAAMQTIRMKTDERMNADRQMRDVDQRLAGLSDGQQRCVMRVVEVQANLYRLASLDYELSRVQQQIAQHQESFSEDDASVKLVKLYDDVDSAKDAVRKAQRAYDAISARSDHVSIVSHLRQQSATKREHHDQILHSITDDLNRLLAPDQTVAKDYKIA